MIAEQRGGAFNALHQVAQAQQQVIEFMHVRRIGTHGGFSITDQATVEGGGRCVAAIPEDPLKTGGPWPSNASPAIGVRRSTKRHRSIPATVGEPNSGFSPGLQSRLLVSQQPAVMCSGICMIPVDYATCAQVTGRADASSRDRLPMEIASIRATAPVMARTWSRANRICTCHLLVADRVRVACSFCTDPCRVVELTALIVATELSSSKKVDVKKIFN